MRCQEISQLMSLYLDEALTADEFRQLQMHLDGCPGCQARWATMKRISQLFAAAPLVPPPAGFVVRVSQRLAQRQARRRWLLGGLSLITGLISIAVLLLPTIMDACMVLEQLFVYSLWLRYGSQLMVRLISVARPLAKAVWLAITALLSPSGWSILAAYALAVFALTALWAYLVSVQQKGYQVMRLAHGPH